MTADTTDSGTGKGAPALAAGKSSAKAAPSRTDRRKAALKANMARRKEQARLRAAQQWAGADDSSAAPDAEE